MENKVYIEEFVPKGSIAFYCMFAKYPGSFSGWEISAGDAGSAFDVILTTHSDFLTMSSVRIVAAYAAYSDFDCYIEKGSCGFVLKFWRASI